MYWYVFLSKGFLKLDRNNATYNIATNEENNRYRSIDRAVALPLRRG